MAAEAVLQTLASGLKCWILPFLLAFPVAERRTLAGRTSKKDLDLPETVWTQIILFRSD